jgi:flagellar protein FliS
MPYDKTDGGTAEYQGEDMRQAAKVYFETQVTTTSQGQVLIMLYDGAIKFLTQARTCMEARDYAGKGKLISSAIDVINELASSLNPDKGGDLAANLNQLYFYCNKRLFMANSRMEIAGVDEVIKILSGIRSAYAQIVDSPEAVAAMTKVPQPVSAQPRTAIGMHSLQPAGAFAPKAKAHNAYATQGATRAAETAETVGDAEDAGKMRAAEAPAGNTEDLAATAATIAAATPLPKDIPVAGAALAPKPAAPSPMPLPELPRLDAIPPLAPDKRLTASNLYRKFAS